MRWLDNWLSRQQRGLIGAILLLLLLGWIVKHWRLSHLPTRTVVPVAQSH